MKKVLFFIAGISLFLAACNDQATDGGTAGTTDSTAIKAEEKEERNKKTALESTEGFQKLNVDLILKDAAQDLTDYGDGSMPPIKSVDSVRAMLQSWLSAMESVKGSNVVAVADGDWVYVSGEWEGKFKSDIMGLKTAGKSYKAKDVDMFKFNDEGRITEHHNVQSFDYLLSKMGVQMPKK